MLNLSGRGAQSGAEYSLTDDDEQGGLTFEIEKGRLSFLLTAPYREERRRAASEQAKQNGVHKKVADLP